MLALKGAQWWHTSSVGHFFNSTHLWSVELFFMFMVIHLWGKFFMAAWRGRRALTWITGALAFLGSVGTAFTGYLSQTNFDSQWISTQAKDGLNSVGIGAEFNVLNTGQMLLWHVMLLPLVVGVLIVLHIILVRRHGVVPPFDAVPPASADARQRPSCRDSVRAPWTIRVQPATRHNREPVMSPPHAARPDARLPPVPDPARTTWSRNSSSRSSSSGCSPARWRRRCPRPTARRSALSNWAQGRAR